MDKLLALQGGQPLRADDWQSIQNIYSDAFKALVTGLSSKSAVIVSGIQQSVSGSTLNVSAGVFFDGTELSSVPAASFTVDVLKSLYLVQVVETSDNRVFHDGTSHDVFQTRRYALRYETAAPSLVCFSVSTLTMLLFQVQLRTGYMIHLESHLHFVGNVSFPSWASAATSSQIQINKNLVGLVQIIAAFNASLSVGELFVLPAGCRPPSDIVLPFWDGLTMAGVCLINSSGGVWLRYVSTTRVNYINLSFQVLYDDSVHYDVPTSSWTLEM